jgi:hypothetical protein
MQLKKGPDNTQFGAFCILFLEKFALGMITTCVPPGNKFTEW